jgi:predicted aldo/keto reductase-like oxidoreductase
MAYAKSKGLGVVVMGPVAGGRLCSSSEVLRQAVPDRKMKTPELALRFVLANPNVDCALSGMQTLQMVQENAGTTAGAPLQSEEKTAIDRLSIELKQMAELYCTGCGYCMPCPHDVNIPKCFEFMNYHRIYGLTEAARTFYATIGAEWIPGKNASACIDCGECEQKCPQKIPIPEQLKNTHAALG